MQSPLIARIVGATLLTAGLAFAGAAQATLISFQADGSGSDGALSARADFNITDGQLSVTLTNLLGADIIRSAGQALSDITFVLSDNAGTVGTTSATGQFGDVDANGNVTYVSSDTWGQPTSQTDTTPTRWFSNDSISGSTITLEAIGGGQPSQMIVPNVANNGVYSNTNGGFPNFNAYVIGPATFTLALSGVTSRTTVTSAQFSFGTKPDTFLTTTTPIPRPVPEPAALALLSLGLLAMGFVLRRGGRR